MAEQQLRSLRDVAAELGITGPSLHVRMRRRGIRSTVHQGMGWLTPEQIQKVQTPLPRGTPSHRTPRRRRSPEPPSPVVITPQKATAADVVAGGVQRILQELQAQGHLGTAGSELAVMATEQVQIDPQRFQFRLFSHHGDLRAVSRWNADLAGVVSVWQDPADQQVFVVDGHHRAGLARRLQVPTIAVRFLQAANDQEARMIGALVNIAHGNASAIDAAKLVRDGGLTPAQIADHGLPRNGRVLREGLQLAALAPELFTATATGELPEDLALAIASVGPSHTLQRDLLRHAKQHRWSPAAVAEAAEIARFASITTTSNGALLPGLADWETSNLGDLLAVRAQVRAQLKLEHRALGVAARRRSAAVLEAAGSLIDCEAAADARAQVRVATDVFTQLAGQSGVISDLLQAMAVEVSSGRSAAEVVAEHLDLIRQAVAAELGA